MNDKTAESGSLLVLLRALVMLVFLVGLPGVAVLKGSFPELADRIAERCRVVLASLSDQVSQSRAADSAPVHAEDQRQPADVLPDPFQFSSDSAPVPSTSRMPDDMATQNIPVMHAARQSGSAVQGMNPSTVGLAGPGASDSPIAAGAVVDPVRRDEGPQALGPPAPLDRQQAEQLAGVLRELGATYYRLETWGDDGAMYRFQCKMALGGDPHVNRHFESTDADANRAIQQVVQRVEQWRRTAVR